MRTVGLTSWAHNAFYFALLQICKDLNFYNVWNKWHSLQVIRQKCNKAKAGNEFTDLER